jgi:hypothetical protein
VSATPKAPAHPAPEPPVYAFSAMMGRAAVYVYAVLLTGCGAAVAQRPDPTREPPAWPRFMPPTPACALAAVRVIQHPEIHHPLYPSPAHADTMVVWECPGIPRGNRG